MYTLTEQIRCKMARGTIEQEINDHIEDQKAEFLGEGMGQTEAEEAAIREMGDPVEVGLEMDRIHRPTMATHRYRRPDSGSRAPSRGKRCAHRCRCWCAARPDCDRGHRGFRQWTDRYR